MCDVPRKLLSLLSKDGDKTHPRKWRQISQTVILANILEKIIHKQLLTYFLENNMLAKFQYGFLPGKLTKEAVFNAIRHMYGSINQNKVMGALFMDAAKAFNCINHDVLCK